MIVASRIPELTERMLAATRVAAQAPRPADDLAAHRADSPAHRLVRRLEALGYSVRIARRSR
jgi:hypothetical protein